MNTQSQHESFSTQDNDRESDLALTFNTDPVDHSQVNSGFFSDPVAASAAMDRPSLNMGVFTAPGAQPPRSDGE